jgi:hypothetical protein
MARARTQQECAARSSERMLGVFVTNSMSTMRSGRRTLIFITITNGAGSLLSLGIILIFPLALRAR